MAAHADRGHDRSYNAYRRRYAKRFCCHWRCGIGSVRIESQDAGLITPQSLNTFEHQAGNDSRFSKDSDGRWVYTCDGTDVEGLKVEFEFLAIGGEFVPRLCGITAFDPVWVASLPDIAVMKANAYENRCESRDLKDLVYALGALKRAGLTLAQSGIERSDIAIIRAAIAGDEEREWLLSQVMG